MWFTLGAYTAGTILFVVGTVFGLPRITSAALVVSAVGLATHVTAAGIRWVRVGHAPYLGFYEVISAYAMVTVATFLVAAGWKRSMRPLGIALMPLALLALGAAMLADKGAQLVSGALASWWLTIHVTFAKFAYSSLILGFALAVVYLMRERPGTGGRMRAMLDKLPSQEDVDDLSFKFIAAGTLFTAAMIGAGAIWANEAWGRYWAWDPIETWSLVTWLAYSLYLHLRLTMGWRGRRAAWYAVAALPLMVFSFLAVPVVYNSIHAAYLRGL